jgi:hypothetical protein
VEHYIKQSVNQWLFTEYDDREATVTFASLAVAIVMSELYETILAKPIGSQPDLQPIRRRYDD